MICLQSFTSPYGRCRWLRLPFGLQKRVHQELQCLHGVKCIADDALFNGKNDLDQGSNLAKFSADVRR